MAKRISKLDLVSYLLVFVSFIVLILMFKISKIEHIQIVGPYWNKDHNEYNNELIKEITYNKQGLYSNIVVTGNSIYSDGHIMCSDSFFNGLHFFLQSKIPQIINEDPQSAFVLGYGCGYIAKYLEELKIPKITVVELEPYMLEAAKYLNDFEKNIKSEYAKIIIDDARNYLQFNNDNKFDIIISDPPQQQLFYSTNIYSLEFFQIVKEALSEEGSFNTWYYNSGLENMEILYNTLLDVFDNVYLVKLNKTQYIFIAADTRITQNHIDNIKLINLNDFGKKHTLSELESFGLYDCKDPINKENIPINTDDNLYIEINSSKTYYTKMSESKLNEIPKYLDEFCTKLI